MAYSLQAWWAAHGPAAPHRAMTCSQGLPHHLMAGQEHRVCTPPPTLSPASPMKTPAPCCQPMPGLAGQHCGTVSPARCCSVAAMKLGRRGVEPRAKAPREEWPLCRPCIWLSSSSWASLARSCPTSSATSASQPDRSRFTSAA
ncbi:hypothetical protein HaLaN_24263 [Haematococcus lacustris]|uniref:Uncharacterized protein n=1 Tax=Haematococcus lacustris TaxID=44745 RepID=A0A6A0A4R5_HAELA|nr:hypothetical protein HaLaN_24263 [Haematococcus lacustris]